jgi:hypothetical protein
MTVAGMLRRIVVRDFAMDIDKQRRLPVWQGWVNQTGRVVSCV